MKPTTLICWDHGFKLRSVRPILGTEIMRNRGAYIIWLLVFVCVATSNLTFFAQSATLTNPNMALAQADLPLKPPNAPQNITIVPKVNSLDVFWNPPVVDGNNAATSYIVDWDPGAQSAPVTFNSFGIPNLTAGTTYMVTVIALNDAGMTYPTPVEGVPLDGAAVQAVRVDDSSITETAADMDVTLVNSDSESRTVYVRLRAPPIDGEWSATTSVTTSGTTATISLSGLTANTAYEAEASLDQAFLQDVAIGYFNTHGPPTQPFLSLVPGEGTLTA